MSKVPSRMSFLTTLIKLTLLLVTFCVMLLCLVDDTTKSASVLLIPSSDAVTNDYKNERENLDMTGIDLLRHVHQSPFPASAAGQWVYQPNQVHPPSLEYLKCLNRERHGNCHNSPALRSKQPRMRAISNGFVRNCPGNVSRHGSIRVGIQFYRIQGLVGSLCNPQTGKGTQILFDWRLTDTTMETEFIM